MALLPQFPLLGLERITLVRTREEALQAWDVLQLSAVWGFDTESKPTFFKDQVSEGPHILQLATMTHAWVIQLVDHDCMDTVASWMVMPDHTKVGFGLGDDCKRMVRKFGVEPCNVLDLNNVFHARGYRKDMGVRGAVAVLFQQNFAKSKKAATSDWSKAHLTDAQLKYAANDAYAAVQVHQALNLHSSL